MRTILIEREKISVALNIPSNYAQVAVQFKREGDPDPWYVTYGILLDEGSGAPNVIADNLAEAWEDTMRNLWTTDMQLSGIQLRIGSDTQDPLTLFYPKAITGTAGGTTLPQNCAMLITKQTSRPGRTGKGRMFWPVIQEGDVNGIGQISITPLGTMQNAVDDLFAAHAEGTGIPSAYPMFLLHNEGVPGGDSPTEIVNLQIAPVIATQRRRLR